MKAVNTPKQFRIKLKAFHFDTHIYIMPSSVIIDIPSPDSTHSSHDGILSPPKGVDSPPTSPIEMPKEKHAPTVTSQAPKRESHTILITYCNTPLSEVLDKQPYTLV